MYASMARTLLNYFDRPGSRRYDRGDIHPLNYLSTNSQDVQTDGDRSDASLQHSSRELDETSWLSAASIFQTFDALKKYTGPLKESMEVFQ
jgi:hypothetical protein